MIRVQADLFIIDAILYKNKNVTRCRVYYSRSAENMETR